MKSYICVLFSVSLNLLINSNFIVIYLPLSILTTTFILFFLFLVCNHYGIFFEFNSKASIVSSLDSPLLYLSIIFISCLTFIIDYDIKLFNIYFNKSLSSRILLRKFTQKRRKSLFLVNYNISSKSVSNNKINSNSNSNSIKNLIKLNNNQSKDNTPKLTSSFINHQNSNNNLITKSANYILNKINEPDPSIKGRNSNKFSLKFRNINKIINYNDSQNN